jgi:hypothetical protein
MTRVRMSLIGIASCVLLAVAGIYGWLGDSSFIAAGMGLLACLISAGLLLSTQSLDTFGRPHPCIWPLFGLATSLHLYENLSGTSESFSIGFFCWTLAPHILALVLSCFRATRLPALAGAAVALLMDAWTFHRVFVYPASSTAAIALIWIPLWNILIFVPGATWIAWLINRRRQSAAQAP